MAGERRGKKLKASPAVSNAKRSAPERGTAPAGRAQAGRYHSRAERTAAQHRDVQRHGEKLREKHEQSGRKKNGKSDARGTATQAGVREQPQPPLPAQHLAKPGNEHELRPRPNYLAPGYIGSGKLQNMVAIVTGADSGIGRAVAVLFAREGADVVVAYLSEHEDADETRGAVLAEGRECIVIPGDVSDRKYCQRLVEACINAFGKLDILVNNAAFQLSQQSLEDITPEQFDLTMKTNLYGYFYLTQAALPHLRGGSSIINTGSVVGIHGSKHLIDYGMTKGAIHNFTMSLAQNLAEKGIRVNAVAPGPVWTPLNPSDRSAADLRDFGADVPMRRPAQPEEVSPAFVFLAAPSCSSYITGEVIGVMGGET